MEKLSFYLFLLIGGNFLLAVTCYPNGQVTPSCSNMIPDHGVSAQTTIAPYNITASKNTYSPGEKITVTLQGSDVFEGFLLQARKDGGTAAVGTFTVTDATNSQGLNCNGPNSAVSHKSSTGLTNIQATWVAPSSSAGDLEFRATFVKSKLIFWVQVKSSQVTVNTTAFGSSSSSFNPNIMLHLPLILFVSGILVCYT
ncbi:putative ferric-chelate reductase 1 [Acipenser ruthenus]|uniref:putative ferric-chelate reductase 1 n=1 Tax=Acipenser ruthenus TaxID=7906 RepID=UPI00145A4E67|nr:putative ferric-chelate reductase 1 [Acipenser ruthenus]XP_058890838.1 putative ferric-chelate reductase 1 [Acipenser ruthenus]